MNHGATCSCFQPWSHTGTPLFSRLDWGGWGEVHTSDQLHQALWDWDQHLGLGSAPVADSKIADVKPSDAVESDFGVSQTKVQIPAFSLAGCLTLGQVGPFPGSQVVYILED